MNLVKKCNTDYEFQIAPTGVARRKGVAPRELRVCDCAALARMMKQSLTSSDYLCLYYHVAVKR